MDRSLTVAMANVESSLRQILAACQALFCQADALLGVARASTSTRLLPTTLALDLHQAAQNLVISAEASLTALVASRFCLRDWIAWMRATGSAIKARGTAPQSAQRENAKKRRMTDATLQRILEYLEQTQQQELKGETDTNACVSARVMGLSANRFWDTKRETVFDQESVCTLPHALQLTAKAFHAVFAAPRLYLQPRTRQVRVVLPSSNESVPGTAPMLAVGSRKGASWDGPSVTSTWKYPAVPATGFFDVPSEPRAVQVDQWTLVLKTNGTTRVDLYAFAVPSSIQNMENSSEPLWEDFDSEDEDEDDQADRTLESFYLTTSLELPEKSEIKDIVFFGDDGKSSLYSDNSSPLSEQRQSLGLIVQRMDALELWVVPNYEKGLTWESRDYRIKLDVDNQAQTLTVTPSQGSTTMVEPVGPDEDEDDADDGVLAAKVRTLATSSVTPSMTPRLFVSGSRGIAAVVENESTHSRVSIWDLNEDEEDEENDEDQEDMDED